MKSSSQAKPTSASGSNSRNRTGDSDSPDSSGSSDDHLPTPENSAFGKGGRSSENQPRLMADRDSADLEKVRDLLFGSQAKQHERDLQQQAERLEQLESRLSDRLGAMEKEFATKVRDIEATLRDELQFEVAAIVARLDEQGSNKVERSDLRSMLSDLANRIGE